jgi:hypothetical protein
MIGGQEQKSEEEAFAPPQLAGSTKEIISANNRKGAKETGTPDKGEIDCKPDEKLGRKSGSAYPMHPPYVYPLHRNIMPYYHMGGMPPGGMPPGGSMRVVMGGPPPKGSSPPLPGMGSLQNPMPPHFPAYPAYPPPPQGMDSQYLYSYRYYDGPPPPMEYTPYQGYYPHPSPRHMQPMYRAQQQPMQPMYGAQHQQPPPVHNVPAKKGKTPKAGTKRGPLSDSKTTTKKPRKIPEWKKVGASVHAINMLASGENENDRAAAAAMLRGVTMRPSGKWMAQMYFAGKSRYIGVFDTIEKAALAYEIAREKLKWQDQGLPQDSSATGNLVNAAQKAALEGVKERNSTLELFLTQTGEHRGCDPNDV